MTEIIKLAEESIGAFLVGKRVIDTKYRMAKYAVVKEAAKVMSSAVSLVLFGIGLFSLCILLMVGSGYWLSVYYDQPVLTLLVPSLLLGCALILLWVKRATVFHRFAKEILRDLIE